MRKLTATLCLTLAVLLGSVGCTTVREQTSYPMGENQHKIWVRGNNFATSSDLKIAWNKQATQLCPRGHNVININRRSVFFAGYAKPVLEGIVVCKPHQNIAHSENDKNQSVSKTFGSGFFVSKIGHIITNQHVVSDCRKITVGDNATKQVAASILEKDKRNDLALLRISSTQMASVETKSLISKLGLKLVPLASGGLVRSEDVELGEDVLVAGYPYGELFSNSIKVTKGIVSSNKGMGDDSGQFQMDAAVQPGNSGGPIYDENGNIVGVVISQLNKLKVAKAIGSLPENVNFGIKASTVRQFLTSAGLPTKWSNRTERKSTKELAQIAKNQTVMVVCNP